jgi:AraC-like DNA-binding protein
MAPELGAQYERLDARVDGLRVIRTRSRRIATDYRLEVLALPPPSTFSMFSPTRSALSILLRGYGRFEEGERATYLRPGDVIVSSSTGFGTEAYAGEGCSWLCIEWEPGVFGTQFRGQRFEMARLSHRELELMGEALDSLDGPAMELATAAILDRLRAAGFPVNRVDQRQLCMKVDSWEPQLQDALSSLLSRLDELPDIVDLSTSLRWSQRLIHRRLAAMARKHRLISSHWRHALHRARVVRSLQLLAAPGATTEQVSRLAGFRSPSSLCHAFSELGLPSPGRLAEAASGDVLSRWSEVSLS